MKKLRVAAVIPCFNEEKSIASTIRSLCQQRYKLSLIVVVDDASTDGTSMVLKKLKESIPVLQVITSEKPLLRAGALNRALESLPSDIDLVLRVDADTQIDLPFVKIAVNFFRQYPLLGGICGRAGLRPGHGLLYRLQKLEYGAGFDAERTATFTNVLVLHGMACMFRRKALNAIGGFAQGHRIEDYEATLRLKNAGYQAMFHPALIAETAPPDDIFVLLRQRYRWMRGGIDVLLGHGINKYTYLDALDHLFFLMVLTLLLLIAFISLRAGQGIHFRPHIIAALLGITTYANSIYRLKFVRKLEFKDVFLRLIILPELIYTVVLSLVQIWAYITAIIDLVLLLGKRLNKTLTNFSKFVRVKSQIINKLVLT